MSYRVVFRSVNGTEAGGLTSRFLTRRGAERARRRFLRIPIPEPVPGRPLFTAEVERR